MKVKLGEIPKGRCFMLDTGVICMVTEQGLSMVQYNVLTYNSGYIRFDSRDTLVTPVAVNIEVVK